jgi:hypothetical protein
MELDMEQGIGSIANNARGMSGPFGKFDCEIKTHVDEKTHALWLRLCNAKCVTSGELLRDVLYLLVHDKTPAELVGDDRRGMLRGEGPSDALARVGGRA